MKIARARPGLHGLHPPQGPPEHPAGRTGGGGQRRRAQLTGDLSGVQGNIGGPGERLDFSGLRKYRDWREAVADPEAEAVDICLPTDLHAPAAIAALRAGKHVLVEKPMALDGAEADAMLEAARRTGRILMVAQVLRFFPAYRVLADAGEIGPARPGAHGDVPAALGRARLERLAARTKRVSGGGVFDLLVHDVDMCLHLFGPPEAVSAIGLRGSLATASTGSRPSSTIPAWPWPSRADGILPAPIPFSMEYSVVADGGAVEYSSAGAPPTLYGRRMARRRNCR